MSQQEFALTSAAVAGAACTVLAVVAAWLLLNPGTLATLIRSFL